MNLADTWHIIGWSLAALTVLALLYAALADPIRRRFRKARRCPKCWYDLSHTPGLTCSECGYTARREKQLFKARRRKRWVVAALLAWIGSYFAFRAPEVRERGWVAAVPTTALIAGVPLVDGAGVRTAALERQIAMLKNPGQPSQQPMTLGEELDLRMEQNELTGWQWSAAIHVAIWSESRAKQSLAVSGRLDLYQTILNRANDANKLANPDLLEEVLTLDGLTIHTRSKWPLDEPIMADVYQRCVLWVNDVVTIYLKDPRQHALICTTTNYPSHGGHPLWPPSIWEDGLVSIGTWSAPQHGCAFIITGHRDLTQQHRVLLEKSALSWTREITVPITVGGSVDALLTPVESAEFVTAAQSALSPELQADCLQLNDLTKLLSMLDGATLAVTFEVVWNQIVFARGEAWWWSDGGNQALPVPIWQVKLKPVYDLPIPQRPPPGSAFTLRMVSNPHVALRNFSSDRYWSGEITIPVRWSNSPWENTADGP